MTWSVVWKPLAEDGLTTLWLNAPDKAALTAAANRIDAQLRRDPFALGESHDNSRHLLVDPPLAVLYRIDPMDRMVTVSRVWRVDSDASES